MIPIHDKRLREVLSRYGRKGILKPVHDMAASKDSAREPIYLLINRLRAIEHESLPANMHEAEALLLVTDARILPKQGDLVIIENDRWRVESALRIGDAGSRLFQAQLASVDIG